MATMLLNLIPLDTGAVRADVVIDILGWIGWSDGGRGFVDLEGNIHDAVVEQLLP